ncbi:MAG: MoxR family ATPase [Agitococcus sp.]|nr:MoxR family ATPase [Agitococcus sp.]
MNTDELLEYTRNAKKKYDAKTSDYYLDDEIQGAYPFWDGDSLESLPSMATIFVMKERMGGKLHNVMIACHGDDEFFIWCGDNFCENSATKPPAESRVIEAANRMDVLISRPETLMEELRGRAEKSDGCHFWQNYKKDQTLCKHCDQLLHLKSGKVSDILYDLQERYFAVLFDTPGANEVSLPQTALAKILSKVPVLIEGEKGWGKTREARMLADTLGAKYIEIQGHENVEAADLTGYTVRHGHDMVWKDGRLSQAFRLAAAGTKVCLNIDEMLRIPQRQLSVLLSALSPYDGQYFLATGRMTEVIAGIGTEETIACLVSNLHVIGTTNIGAQYAVDTMDPALQERFLLRRKYADVTVLKAAVLEISLEKGFSTKVADNCVAFYEAMKSLKPNGLVADIPNPRTMVRAVHLSDKETDMKAAITMQALTWVGRDVEGNPVQEQLEAVTKAIAKVWK